ncbi:MAG: hypothetical protein L6V95_13110 [Candidatus Melainabacteria bacterium]|nr:MAG: hypothetical protein L6V95_13110 [Candidatus Melainabacteria bacterium]
MVSTPIDCILVSRKLKFLILVNINAKAVENKAKAVVKNIIFSFNFKLHFFSEFGFIVKSTNISKRTVQMHPKSIETTPFKGVFIANEIKDNPNRKIYKKNSCIIKVAHKTSKN